MCCSCHEVKWPALCRGYVSSMASTERDPFRILNIRNAIQHFGSRCSAVGSLCAAGSNVFVSSLKGIFVYNTE